MRYLLISICFIPFLSFSQSNTEIFLFDINTKHSKIEINTGKNLSNNKGYDNQPSFVDDHTILFASTKNEQTDILKYNTSDFSKTWISSTEGGEYTPLQMPNKNGVSAVRLDKDGKQRLYAYDMITGESTELIKDVVVAYYTWFNESIIVSAVIENDDLNLYVHDIKNGTNKKYASKVGRSFHKIPNANLVSFISKSNSNLWQIKSLNPLTGEIKLIANTIKGVEDICWLNSKTLLSSKGSVLYKLTLQKDYNWKKVKDVSDDGIENITRLAVNSKGSKLLLAGDVAEDYSLLSIMDSKLQLIEEHAAQIVDKHIDPFNNRNLKEFSNAFNINVIVKSFPAEIMYYGRDNLIEHYKLFYENNEKSSVKVVNRMTLKNVVIDEELVTLNNTTKRQVTIYETDDDEITTMTFIENSKLKKKQEVLINEQIEMYNKKDVKPYGRTFSTDVKVYDFPHELSIDGRPALRDQYISLVDTTPNLYAEIVNRIIIGNKVIDKIKTTINDTIEYTVAIYEIENGLISAVTYIK
ncbi:steroid delta-isomerase [Winogradskyella sp. SM1960]|uniref:steroid delta-isomerase n=1 Tax=Winogradskyella sp. SM1960 TaxID=2865955 RepID=UPI001CD4599F|nr:steroid delta-isomerase [Winogradskyella sp. SM1960]